MRHPFPPPQASFRSPISAARIANGIFVFSRCGATGSISKRLQEDLCYRRVARRAPMTVGKKMNRIGGQRVVKIDADVRIFAEDRRGKAELRSEEIAGALMGQGHS